jgi:hypothetical protein
MQCCGRLQGTCSCRADHALNFKVKQVKMQINEKENKNKDIGLIYKNARKAFKAQKPPKTVTNAALLKYTKSHEPKKRTIQD